MRLFKVNKGPWDGLGYRVQNKVIVAAKSWGKRFEWEEVNKMFAQYFFSYIALGYKIMEETRYKKMGWPSEDQG